MWIPLIICKRVAFETTCTQLKSSEQTKIKRGKARAWGTHSKECTIENVFAFQSSMKSGTKTLDNGNDKRFCLFVLIKIGNKLWAYRLVVFHRRVQT